MYEACMDVKKTRSKDCIKFAICPLPTPVEGDRREHTYIWNIS